MTIKHLTGRYPRGFTLRAAYTGLVIESTARVGGAGVSAAFFATIQNEGVVHATNGGAAGVSLSAGGMVTNGSASDTTALIEGYNGVRVGGSSGAVANFGTIEGVGSRFSAGVSLSAGGMVTNGSATDTTALIEGYNGVIVGGSSGAVANFGTIKGVGSRRFGVGGVILRAGGMVTNGSATDATALIEGADYGLYVQGSSATVANFGTIEGVGGYGYGVVMTAGGTVTNGSATDTTALIEGVDGVLVYVPSVTVTNFGTIQGAVGGHGDGVFMTAGGMVTNGSADDIAALIEANTGVRVDHGKGKVFNFGTILPSDVHGSSIGVSLSAGGRVTNGSAADRAALIESAYVGVVVHGSGTVTNFGTIFGRVEFFSASDKLRVEAGAVFRGAVLGGGGVLALASGKGTIDALAGGDVTVSSRHRATTYSHFATLKLAKGTRFTLSESGAIAGGGTATLIDDGRLIVTGALAVSGTLLGRGAIVLAGGARVEVDGAAPASLSTAFKSGAAATLALGAPAGFAATIAGFAAGETIDLLNTAATGAALNGSDQLVITNGATTVATLQLRGDYAGASFDLASDGHGGTAITLTPGPAAHFVSAMASMTAGAAAPHAPVWKPEEAFRPLLASPQAALA